MPDIACLNGTVQPLENARVSVNDRGFLFGDGVYEVVRTYDGAPFRLEEHLDRLLHSLEQIRLIPDWERQTLKGWIAEALERAGYREAKVYVQVTRGAAPRNHPFPAVPPTTLITVTEVHPLAEDLVKNGARAITTPDIRWGRCDIKSLNLLPNVMARQAALDAGAFEALFVTGDGEIREGSSSNVFLVRGGELLTPALGPGLLAGVSRAYLIELIHRVGLKVTEGRLDRDTLDRADEVFLSGTTIEVLPVVTIDGKPVGGGAPGPVTHRLQAAFRPTTGGD